MIMGYPTNIEWCDATWNPIGGCSIKSPGCINCYAQSLAGTRLLNHPLYRGTTDNVKGKPVFNGKMTVVPDDHPVWTWPLKWRGAKHPVMGADMPSLIFVGDMSDLFHENRPDEVILHVLDVIRRASFDGGLNCGAMRREHIFQVLTKRPDRMAAFMSRLRFNQKAELNECALYLADDGHHIVMKNLWLGTSCERQQEADERIPLLLQTPAAVRFISAEPLIGPIDFVGGGRQWLRTVGQDGCATRAGLDQIITGGESGPDRRECDPAWMRDIRDQCLADRVAYFTKQMTGKKAIPPDLQIRQFPATKPLPVVVGAPSAPEPRMRLL